MMRGDCALESSPSTVPLLMRLPYRLDCFDKPQRFR